MISLLIISLLLSNCLASVSDTISNDVVINKALVSLDLTTHITKYSASISVENKGSTDVKSFLFAIHSNYTKQLSFFGASVCLIGCFSIKFFNFRSCHFN